MSPSTNATVITRGREGTGSKSDTRSRTWVGPSPESVTEALPLKCRYILFIVRLDYLYQKRLDFDWKCRRRVHYQTRTLWSHLCRWFDLELNYLEFISREIFRCLIRFNSNKLNRDYIFKRYNIGFSRSRHQECKKDICRSIVYKIWNTQYIRDNVDGLNWWIEWVTSHFRRYLWFICLPVLAEHYFDVFVCHLT